MPSVHAVISGDDRPSGKSGVAKWTESDNSQIGRTFFSLEPIAESELPVEFEIKRLGGRGHNDALKASIVFR